MITREDAEKILIANGISFDEINPCSLNISGQLGSEISYQLGDSILIGHLSVFSNDNATTLRLGVWDYTRDAFLTLNFAGVMDIDNMLVLLNDISTNGGVNVIASFVGYKARVQ